MASNGKQWQGAFAHMRASARFGAITFDVQPSQPSREMVETVSKTVLLLWGGGCDTPQEVASCRSVEGELVNYFNIAFPFVRIWRGVCLVISFVKRVSIHAVARLSPLIIPPRTPPHMPRSKKSKKTPRAALGTSGTRPRPGERPAGPSPRVGASLSVQDLERFKQAAKTLGATESEIIRRALAQLLGDLSAQAEVPRLELSRAGRPRLGEVATGPSPRIGAAITEQDRERLARASESLGMPEAEVIRLAVVRFLDELDANPQAEDRAAS